MPDARINPLDRLQGLAARPPGRLPVLLQVRISGRPPIAVDGQTLDPQVQLILAIRRKRSPHSLCEPSPAETRARLTPTRCAGVSVRARRFHALAHGFVNMTGVSPAAHRATVQIARDWHALLDTLRC